MAALPWGSRGLQAFTCKHSGASIEIAKWQLCHLQGLPGNLGISVAGLCCAVLCHRPVLCAGPARSCCWLIWLTSTSHQPCLPCWRVWCGAGLRLTQQLPQARHVGGRCGRLDLWQFAPAAHSLCR